MRLRRVFAIAGIILLSLAAAVFVAFSDFGSSQEPLINGIRLRRYVGANWSHLSGAPPLGSVGADAIPWLIKGVEAKDSSLYTLKARAWKLLPIQLQFKWRNRQPINPATLRLNCVRVLEMFGPEAVAAAPALVEFAKSHPNLQGSAFRALAEMASDSPQAKAFLVASLRDGDDAMKRAIVGAFRHTGFTPAEAVPLLIERLENYVPPDPRAPLPHNEMSALSVCGPEAAQAVPVLIQYMMREGPRYGIRGYGIWALRATGAAALPALPRLLEILEGDDETAVRLKTEIFAILARLGPSGAAALPALTNGLADANPVVRTLAAAGIANITGDLEFAVPRLIELLENRNRSGEITLTVQISTCLIGFSHRELAVMLLGEFGTQATNALPSLREIVNSNERGLQTPAAEAIWKISRDTNAVLSALVTRLQTSTSEVGRMLAFNALGEMGPAAKPAIPAIRATMESDLKVRRYGYVALQRIEGRVPSGSE